MTERVVVDPITRIEGHLRIEAALDGARIAQAYSSGTMVRGIEIILRGRDPRDAWAFAQRICGVCTLVHGIASTRAVEAALRYPIPANAGLIRNLMLGAQMVHDHVMHFYHLHALDWVDLTGALNADPQATADLARGLGRWPKSSPGHFADVQTRLKAFIDSGQLGIFANGYWGHGAYRLPPEVNLLAVSHYLDALAWQREVVRLHAIFGGKNPHPNCLVGGVPCAIDLDSEHAINAGRLDQVQAVIAQLRDFVEQVYLPDTLAIAGFYKDWGERGEGLGNFLCYGDLCARGDGDPATYLFPRGALLGRDLSVVHPVDMEAPEQIEEFIAHAWYDYSGETGNGVDPRRQGRHPYAGETRLDYQGRGGPAAPIRQMRVEDGYSWIKSPRWKGHAMEVGPLARVLMQYASGQARARELVDDALARLGLPLRAMFSTLGRTAARALEARMVAEAMQGWFDALMANIRRGDTRTFNADLWQPATWPMRCQGVGYMEAPRGALGHWVVIENGRIANYQAVVPSTWNAGPRDAQGQPGAYEAALQDNHLLLDPDQPVEIQRTIHSFDPCIACAVHVADVTAGESLRLGVAWAT
jgi:hydrogenase large subunit